MNMYISALFAIAALFVWPDKNIVDVPFSQLTLKLIGTTIVFLYLAYASLKFVFHSFAEDKFWPWRWTAQVIKSLLLRCGFLGILGFVMWIISENEKWNALANEYSITSLILVFIAVTWIVCVSDEEFFEKSPNNSEQPVASQLHE